MISLFILLVFGVVVRGDEYLEACGLPSGCYCSGPILHLISCRNITIFPIFNEHIRTGVIYIDLYKTKIIGLPVLTKSEWPSLNYINLKDNAYLDCASVSSLQRDGLSVLTNCDSAPENEITTRFMMTNNTPVIEDDVGERNDVEWVLPSIVGFASLFGLLSVIGECMKRYNKTMLLYDIVRQNENGKCVNMTGRRETVV